MCLLQTGASKGYAFVEFQDHEVAKVVADTMNNYLMYERNLKCKFYYLFAINYFNSHLIQSEKFLVEND